MRFILTLQNYLGAFWSRLKSSPLRFVGRMIRRLCILLGALVLIGGVSSCGIGMYLADQIRPEPLGDNAVLVVRLTPKFNSTPSDYAWLDNPLAPPPPTFEETLLLLERAVDDPKIKGIVFSLRGADISAAMAEELRAPVLRAKAAGKFTAIYAPSYEGLSDYYLASAFDQVWVQPVGVVMLGGLGGSQPYFKGLFDKIGIGAMFIQRHEYKSAMENMTGTQMSVPARAMTEGLIKDVAKTIVSAVAQDRGLTKAQVWAAIDQGIMTTTEARAAKLVDHTGHGDELTASIRTHFGRPADDEDAVDFVSPRHYVALTAPPEPRMIQKWAAGQNKTMSSKRVALVTIAGPIYSEHEGGGLMMNKVGNTTADDVVAAIREAVDDDTVAAILVRIDSPGGTPGASEDIRHALLQAKEKNKPVIISMVDVAASGGYWVATSGGYMLANALTLTGSIGVVGGKFDIGALSQQWGVTWDGARLGKNVDLFSPHQGFTPTERARMEVLMDDTYDYFTKLVVNARHLTPAVVDQLARGRVWTGAQAKDNGLVDQVGGYIQALDYTARFLNVASRNDLSIELYPAPLTPFQTLLDMLKGQAMMARMSTWMHGVITARPSVGVYVWDDPIFSSP